MSFKWTTPFSVPGLLANHSGFSMKVFSIKILTKHPLQNLDLTKTSKFVPNLASESRLSFDFITSTIINISFKTRSSWLNCALRDDEAVYWVSIGHYEAVAAGDVTWSVEGIHAFIYCTKRRSGQVSSMPY